MTRQQHHDTSHSEWFTHAATAPFKEKLREDYPEPDMETQRFFRGLFNVFRVYLYAVVFVVVLGILGAWWWAISAR